MAAVATVVPSFSPGALCSALELSRTLIARTGLELRCLEDNRAQVIGHVWRGKRLLVALLVLEMNAREEVAQKPADGVHIRASVGLCESVLLGSGKAPGPKLVFISFGILGAKPRNAKVDQVSAVGGNHYV